MKTKLLRSSTAAFGAILLCLALGACTKTNDSAANSGADNTSGNVASNDAGTGATANSPSPAVSGTTADAQSQAAVNPNPPVSAVEVALMGDPSLSSAAKNIQVSADNDKLVLRGSVPSSDLKARIEQKAKEVARDVQIDNQITVSGQQ